MPISQISMQFNAIIMALAGGQRIFKMLDEKPAKWTRAMSCWSTPNACRMILVTETKERTNLWAWKRANPDGTHDYREAGGRYHL